MIIDAFTFFNESDILEFRLKMLYEHVDKFVIVEADKTHSGKLKPYNFDEVRFAKWRDKIVYYPMKVDTFDLDLSYRPQGYEPDAPQWKIENRQRSAIIDACKYFSEDDVLMVSDCDEIPARGVIEFRKKNNLVYPMACQQQVSVFSLKYMCPIDWRGTTMATLKYARNIGAQGMRDMRNRYSVMPHGGWHLTYFGGAERVKYKIESFAHAEYNKPEYFDRIPEAVRTGGAIFPDGTPTVPATEQDYPEYFRQLAPKEWWL